MPIIEVGGKRLLFIHVPKTGGTAVEQHFREFGRVYFERADDKALRSRCIARHYHGALIEQLFPLDLFDYAFMVVRHPVSRIVSDYRYYVTRKGLEKKPPSFARWLRCRLWRARPNPYFMDNHFRPQHEFEVPGICVFRYEDGLDAAIAQLAEANGLAVPASLPKANVSAPVKVDPTAADLKIIERRYRADFERYGY